MRVRPLRAEDRGPGTEGVSLPVSEPACRRRNVGGWVSTSEPRAPLFALDRPCVVVSDNVSASPGFDCWLRFESNCRVTLRPRVLCAFSELLSPNAFSARFGAPEANGR